MFLESVDKKEPGKQCFKVIQMIWCFLTNPKLWDCTVERVPKLITQNMKPRDTSQEERDDPNQG